MYINLIRLSSDCTNLKLYFFEQSFDLYDSGKSREYLYISFNTLHTIYKYDVLHPQNMKLLFIESNKMNKLPLIHTCLCFKLQNNKIVHK